jgi:uncharacterized membrane protein
MTTRTDTEQRSPLLVLLGVVGGVGLLRVAARFTGFIALLGIVMGTVAAFAILIVVLRIALLH